MAWGSEKQKAYFKRQAQDWGLFPPCPDVSSFGDVFDLEALKSQHSARLKRAVQGLKMTKDRRRIRKYEKGLDARARRKGFADRHALLASGWTPVSEHQAAVNLKRKRKRTAPSDSGSMWGRHRKAENPFIHNEPMF